jgi:hypothetical protein
MTTKYCMRGDNQGLLSLPEIPVFLKIGSLAIKISEYQK